MRVLEDLVRNTVHGLDLELADVEFNNRGKQIRVFVEKRHEVDPNGGITVSDCEAVSRQLQRVLEVEGIEYDRLEVSSPGLDRKLKKARDFARFTGHVADVKLREAINGRRRFVGIVRDVQGERVELDADGGKFSFDLANLDRARLVPKF
ncbi:MAG: ribosome maturation factor RimP [Betaproteobacteria bacterium]|nr:ribosome maturation factor RimP [Betaproteobacteria bacterium]